MRWLFEAMSDGQGENIHTRMWAYARTQAHTHTHTQPFFCFASEVNV